MSTVPSLEVGFGYGYGCGCGCFSWLRGDTVAGRHMAVSE